MASVAAAAVVPAAADAVASVPAEADLPSWPAAEASEFFALSLEEAAQLLLSDAASALSSVLPSAASVFFWASVDAAAFLTEPLSAAAASCVDAVSSVPSASAACGTWHQASERLSTNASMRFAVAIFSG